MNSLDDKMNRTDFAIFAENFNDGASQSATAALDAFAAAHGLMADVPEPASAAVMVIAGMGILIRRQRYSRLANRNKFSPYTQS
jgi:hypothetical protein